MGLFGLPNQCNTLLLWYGRPVTNPVFLLNRIIFPRAIRDRYIYYTDILGTTYQRIGYSFFQGAYLSFGNIISLHLIQPLFARGCFFMGQHKSHTLTNPWFLAYLGLSLLAHHMRVGECRL